MPNKNNEDSIIICPCGKKAQIEYKLGILMAYHIVKVKYEKKGDICKFFDKTKYLAQDIVDSFTEISNGGEIEDKNLIEALNSTDFRSNSPEGKALDEKLDTAAEVLAGSKILEL